MADVAKGSVLLTPRFDNLMSNVNSQMEKAFGGASGIAGKHGAKASESFGSKFSAKMGTVVGAVSAVTTKACSAIANSLGAAISRVDTMNNFPRVMQALGYSADSASAAVQKMSSHLTGLPTRLDAMTSSVQQIVPTVKDVGKATDIMLAFNDALLAGGASTQVQEAALEQFSQALAKGKPELEDWRSIQTAMPGQLDQVAQSMLGQGKSATDLYNALKNGQISMSDFCDELVRLDTEGGSGFASFAEQAKLGTAGIATSWSNLQNAVIKGVAKVLDAIGSDAITAPMQAMGGAISAAATLVADGVGSVRRWVEQLVGACQRIDEQTGVFSRFGEGVSSVVQAVVDSVGRVIDSFARIAVPNADDAASALASIAEGAMALGDSVGGVDAVSNAIQALGGVLVAAAAAWAAYKAQLAVSAAVSTLASAFESLQIAVMLLKDGEGLLTVAQQLLNSTMKANPIMLVVSLIAALVAAVVYLWNTNEGFRNAVIAAWDAVCGAVGGAIDGIVGFFSNLDESIAQALASFGEFVAGLPAGIAQAAADTVAAAGEFAANLLVQAQAAGQGFLDGVMQFVSNLPENLGMVIGLVLGTALGLVVGLAEYAIEAGSQFLEGVVSSAQQLPGRIAEFVSSIIQNVTQFAASMGQQATSAGSQFLQNVVTFITQLPGRVWSFLTNAITNAGNFASQMAQRAQQAGSQFLQRIVSFFTQLPGRVWSMLSSALSRAGSFASSLPTYAVRAANGFRNSLSNGLNAAVSFVRSIPSRICGIFSGAGSWLANSGRALLNGFTNGIRSGFNNALSAVRNGLSNIRRFFPFSPAKEGPFSGHGYTTYSGKALMQGFGQGIGAAAESVAAQASDALSGVRAAVTAEPIAFAALEAEPASMAVEKQGGNASEGESLHSWLKRNLKGIIAAAIKEAGPFRLDVDPATLAFVLAPYVDDALGTRKEMGF